MQLSIFLWTPNPSIFNSVDIIATTVSLHYWLYWFNFLARFGFFSQVSQFYNYFVYRYNYSVVPHITSMFRVTGTHYHASVHQPGYSYKCWLTCWSQCNFTTCNVLWLWSIASYFFLLMYLTTSLGGGTVCSVFTAQTIKMTFFKLFIKLFTTILIFSTMTEILYQNLVMLSTPFTFISKTIITLLFHRSNQFWTQNFRWVCQRSSTLQSLWMIKQRLS